MNEKFVTYSTPFEYDDSSGLLVAFFIEIKQQVSFKREPTALVALDFATHVQPALPVYRRCRRRECRQILLVYLHFHVFLAEKGKCDTLLRPRTPLRNSGVNKSLSQNIGHNYRLVLIEFLFYYLLFFSGKNK